MPDTEPQVVEIATGRALPHVPEAAPLTESAPPTPTMVIGPDAFTLAAEGKSVTYKLRGVLELGAEGLVPALLWANLLKAHDLDITFRRIADRTDQQIDKAANMDIGSLAASVFKSMEEAGYVPKGTAPPRPPVAPSSE